MFCVISSIVIIIFELICCQIFFESFCGRPTEQDKWQKILLIFLGSSAPIKYSCIECIFHFLQPFVASVVSIDTAKMDCKL